MVSFGFLALLVVFCGDYLKKCAKKNGHTDECGRGERNYSLMNSLARLKLVENRILNSKACDNRNCAVKMKKMRFAGACESQASSAFISLVISSTIASFGDLPFLMTSYTARVIGISTEYLRESAIAASSAW